MSKQIRQGWYTDEEGRKRPITKRRVGKGRPRRVWDDGKTKHSEFMTMDGSMGFCDASIADEMEIIQESGFRTTASCSGLSSDHHEKGQGGAHVSIILPESVAEAKVTGGVSEKPIIKDQRWMARMKKAGDRAGWKTEPSHYMLVVPVVTFREPRYGSFEMDKKIYSHPDYVRADKKAKSLIGATGPASRNPDGSSKFITAIDERHAIETRLAKEHGAKQWTDAERSRRWQMLVSEIALAGEDLKQQTFYAKGWAEEEVKRQDYTRDELKRLRRQTRRRRRRAMKRSKQGTLDAEET